MVALIINKLDLDPGVEWLYSDFEIARDSTFKKESLALWSYRNSKNKVCMLFDEALDPNIKWYARARVMLSTGITAWTNVDVFQPEILDDIDLNTIIPSRVSTPIVTTNFPPDTHAPIMFTINAGKYVALGNNEHISTSYVIEDLSGKVIWYLLKDEINKYSIDVNNIILKAGQVYRIKVMFHALSGDTSQFGCLTIRISDNKNIALLTYLDEIDNSEDVPIELSRLTNIERPTIKWEIISLVDNISSVIWSTTTDGDNYNKIVIPKYTLKHNENFILKLVVTDLENEVRYITFRTVAKYKTPKPDREEYIAPLNPQEQADEEARLEQERLEQEQLEQEQSNEAQDTESTETETDAEEGNVES